MPSPVASRTKLGHAYRHLPSRARKLLSVLFAAGLFFLALLSFSHYVRDPDVVTAKGGVTGGRGLSAGVGSRSRITAGLSGTQASSRSSAPVKLLLASHNRLFWYHVDTDTSHVLHEGQGVHYGVFPGEHTPDGRLKTVWNVIRPHNWHPKSSEEFLVQFDADTGKEVSRVRITSRFTHDAVRRGDRVYLANTEGGEVQELSFPSMKKVRSLKLFTLRQHVNTLAPLEEGAVWVVLHNLGQSDAVKIDLTADPQPTVAAELKSVGRKSHGLVSWRGRLVVLDSEGGGLVAVDPDTGVSSRVWQAPADEQPPKFLKGLCVVDDVAYFGVNVWGSRETRDSTGNDAELAAVDLKTGSLLWRRRVPTHGLLNIVAAPHLGEASTYRAMASAGGGGGGGGIAVSEAELVGGINDTRVVAATQQLIDMGYKPLISGRWSSGLPRMDMKVKDTPRGYAAGISLPLMRVDIRALRERILNMPEDMWNTERQRRENAAVDGRKDNMNKYKPGVEALVLVFSDQSTEHVYRFPYYEYFKDVVEPIIEKVVGRADMNKVVRLQFARMKPGSEIKPHRDMGGYARFAHRIHLPVVTDANVSFQVCPEAEKKYLDRKLAAGELGGGRRGQGGGGNGVEQGCVQIPMEEGMVFELNNRVMHLVQNRGTIKRVQMVVDVAEEPRQPRLLKPGTVCNYEAAVMVCPHAAILPVS